MADHHSPATPSRTGRRGRAARGSGRSERSRASQGSHMGTPTKGTRRARSHSQTAGVEEAKGCQDVDASNSAPEMDGYSHAADDSETNICFICASPVSHTAVAPCNHRTCHICSLRLRALYKNKACAHCRAHADYVVFTDDDARDFKDFATADYASSDDNLGIHYGRADIREDTVLLLRYNCPDGGCDVACLGWPDLHRHVETVHQQVMCDLCTRNKKVFTHEHALFTAAGLKKHRKSGDDKPGAADQSGFKGHPECGFCNERFYGDDELFAHCRDKHEKCHICDRRNEGRQQQYYVDYNGLEVHFRKEHFLCPDAECLAKKFVVFDSDVDLKAHQLEAHPHGLSKDARRDARRIDLSGAGFQVRAAAAPDAGARREGRGGGHGRGGNSNADALPRSTAQPLRRDEMTFQRQLAIQSAQSVSGRTFGGQLSSTQAFTARPPANTPGPPTVTARSSTNSGRGSGNASLPGLDWGPALSGTTVQDQARRQRHNAVTERAAHLLGNNAAKMAEFRSKISAFRSSSITASALIDSFFSLFDASSADLGKLIRELADIFEVASKRDTLLKGWNDWKAINEDYPSLPGAAPLSRSGNAAGHGGSRVLRLKNSTVQSSNAAFPPLASSSTPRAGASGWARSTLPTRPVPSATPKGPAAGRKPATPPSSREAFPALPPAAQRGPLPVRQALPSASAGAGASPASPWHAGSGRHGSAEEWSESATPAEAVETRKRKGKAKKQTLFHFG